MKDIDNDKKSLEALVVDNRDLELLESKIEQFNIFEALGVERTEVRHSNFLSFLLNPSENHGLGDTFVKRFLQKALAMTTGQSLPITLIDLDTWDLDELAVWREWQNIDILLVDERNQLVVIIENKIDSGEHDNQLKNYWEITHQHYSKSRILGLFLTPDGDLPSNENYFPLDYASVCEILENLTETRSSTLGPDIRVAITHYTQMLKRHIMSESEIAELCRRIYRKHQHALNLIFEHRPDQQGAIREILEKLVRMEQRLILDDSSKSRIRFAVKDWEVPLLKQGEGWTRSGSILLFEFVNSPNKLALHLIIGPGPNETRQRLFDIATSQAPFKSPFHSLNKKWNTIYVRQFLTGSFYEEGDLDAIQSEINKKWQQFLEHDLMQIHTVLKSQEWIWEIV